MFFRHKEHGDIAKRGMLNALGAVLYIALVATVMTNISRIFGPGPDGSGILAPMAFLSMFTLSAAVMATLVFGKPAMLYVDGKKKEALQMLGWTIASLAVLTCGVFTFIFVSRA